MKFISWNVNGLRACVDKGFLDAFAALDADFFSLQETKMQPGQLALELPGYRQFWYSAEKKGYSGTAVFTKHEPLSVRYGVGVEELDHEGRLITLEYPGFYLLTCYTPNAQDGLKRIDFRMQWEDALRVCMQKLDADTYYLVEVTPPKGYNKLSSKTTVVVDSDSDKDDSVSGDASHIADGITTELSLKHDTEPDGSVHADIQNNEGTVLPSTGGMGTTLFYVVGAILVIGAGVLLVVRRRMNDR